MTRRKSDNTFPMPYSFLERKHKKNRRKNLAMALIFLFLLASLFSFAYKFLNKGSSFETMNPSLKETAEDSLKDTKGTYGIAVKNLTTGETYFFNENRIFDAGSLYKLWVMAQTYKQIGEGSLKEDENLSASIAALNREFNIASDEAELTEGEISLNVSSALNQMITISHNYASLLLTKKIRLPEVANFLKVNDFNESMIGTGDNPPKTTALDTLKFYEKLYKMEIADAENTQKMIALLKNQKLNNSLPKYLPGSAQVAHKTGDIGRFKHDGGIVYTEKGDYIIVVLSETDSPSGAQERIAGFSKSVYDYFMK